MLIKGVSHENIVNYFRNINWHWTFAGSVFINAFFGISNDYMGAVIND
jgi:hypothetical protein